MLLDRIFGILAAAAFVLGSALHIETLLGRDRTGVFTIETFLFFAMAVLVMMYVQTHVAKRDNIPHDDDGVALVPLIGSLPTWAGLLAILALVYATVLTLLGLVITGEPTVLPDGSFVLMEGGATIKTLSALEYQLRKNALHLGVLAAFSAGCFIFATYCLLRPRTES